MPSGCKTKFRSETRVPGHPLFGDETKKWMSRIKKERECVFGWFQASTDRFYAIGSSDTSKLGLFEIEMSCCSKKNLKIPTRLLWRDKRKPFWGGRGVRN
jgi:hypothetical protein